MKSPVLGNESIRKSKGRLSRTARDLLASAFRHRRLILVTFSCVFLGSILAAIFLPKRYQAETEILVSHGRFDPVVTTGTTTTLQIAPGVTEEELNSEVELLRSRDVLEKVVLACSLHQQAESFWNSRRLALLRALAARPSNGSVLQDVVARAVADLGDKVVVRPVQKTHIIRATYSAQDPQLAVRVLASLTSFYLEKHAEVHRPPGAFHFFEEQAKQYREGLASAEEQLVDFSRSEGVGSVQLEKDILVQKLGDSLANLLQTQANLSQAEERVRILISLLASTPSRMTTQVRTSVNPHLLEQLRATLLNLQNRRAELAGRYAPGYRLMEEINTQIAQTQAAIVAAENALLREETTDQNPTHQWLKEELAKARTDAASLKSLASATDQAINSYRERIRTLDQKDIIQQDLMRTVKSEEQSYLLYLNKREEARISDALDQKRIVNVSVAEAATAPPFPTNPPGLILLVGWFGAALLSAGSAGLRERLDSVLRTPDEVEAELQVPVIASIPKLHR